MTYVLGIGAGILIIAVIYAVHARLTRRTVRDYEESLGVAPEQRKRSAK